ncbi:MAG TPA: hypothetical protein VFD75_13215 [Pyrinomonadaceae bacterium]|nr:hypothetical protein [Pyrinomonadaceae bacterium]
MYIYNRPVSPSVRLVRSPPPCYRDRFEREAFGISETGAFSPSCDPVTATPAFSAQEKTTLVSLLSPKDSDNAIRWNRDRHPTKSGIDPAHIAIDLARYVDFAAVSAAIQQSGGKYTVGATIDAVFVEAAHQFQAKTYFQKDEQSGGVGPSTLDSLGILNHKLRPGIGQVYGRDVLKNISKQISPGTNNEFDATNWFNFIVAPSFLGHRINRQSQGIHVLLLRKLREAENYLLSLPAYKGMTPVQLGKALGLDRKDVNYSGGRISSDKQAMHAVGLALDIDVKGNPWVGAGWLSDDPKERAWLVDQIKNNPDDKLKKKYQKILNARNERYRFLTTLRSAAPASANVPATGTIASFLHDIAVRYGSDSRATHQFLANRNDEFKDYLRTHATELSQWRASATFDNRDPLNGFLNLHTDLVFALRQQALLAWGATDFGPRASGDLMHFDLRTIGVGPVIAGAMGGYVPEAGRHPVR